ncbi:MAG: PAS domain-containing protein, partial [Gammaproteobacteria bacterium]
MADTDKQLRKLYELSLLLSGEPDEIIRQIAGMIAEFYDVRVVVITEIRDQELYFLCAHVDGVLKKHLGHVPLEFTPCALVKEGKQGQFFNEVSDIFPQVDFLKQQKAFFYYGVPAIDSTGNVISTTCLLDEKHHELSEQSMELLRIFGQRIAMELERKSSLAKQALTEEALHHSQSRLYSLTNISPVGIFRTDINGQCIYVNELWCRFSGMTMEQASGDGWTKAVHPDDRQLVGRTWDDSVEAGRDFELEYRFLNPQNKVTWIMGRATAEKNIAGEITGFIGVVTDITDRRKQELENENIRLKLTEAQNIAHLGFFEHEIDTGNTYWSDETYQILGTDPQLTKPSFESFISFVHPDDVPQVLEAREQLRQGGLYDIDYRIIKPDGSESILHGEAKLHIDEKSQQRKIVGTVQDISERKHVENALNALVEFSDIDDMPTFYKSVVYNIAHAYNARFAFLGLFPEGCDDRIVLQAIWAGDDFAKNFEYSLLGTPCADVLCHKIEMVPENAARLYPEDVVLTEMGIESYYGAPLITPSGKKLGLITIMDTKPMRMGHWTKSILGLFAQKLASHIEHSRVEKEIKASQKKLSSILDNMLDIYSRTDSEGLLTMIS